MYIPGGGGGGSSDEGGVGGENRRRGVRCRALDREHFVPIDAFWCGIAPKRSSYTANRDSVFGGCCEWRGEVKSCERWRKKGKEKKERSMATSKFHEEAQHCLRFFPNPITFFFFLLFFSTKFQEAKINYSK